MSPIVWIIIIVMIVGNITYDRLRARSILNGKTPQAVIDFPIYEFNEEELSAVKAEIEIFITDAFENRRCELSLTAKQLNYACNPRIERQGFFPKYYEFQNDKLIEKELIYPDIYNSEGYEIITRTIEFAGSMTSSEYFALNGTPLSDDFSNIINSPIYGLSFWLFLFSSLDSRKISQLGKKITIVEIIDDKLILRI